MNLQSSQMLSSYRLVCKIGEGGMGVVWKALDTRLGREVALKVLPEEMAGSLVRLERFEREAKVVASLNHPNIVTLYSVEEADGTHFITMELIEGRTLGELIPPGGLTLQEFFDYALPLADALAAAHQRGIVHRDLKPANIMVTNEGRLKVLDFGLAKLREPEGADNALTETARADPVTPLTLEGRVVGTPLYMSPEQLQAEPLDHRTDLFSVGIIFYQMATGRRPFKGANSAALISAILRDTPQSVTEAKGDFPNHLSRIVRHCLEKDPERRYQTAKDLRNELDDLKSEILTGEATARFAERPRRVNPLWPVSIIAGVLLIAAVVLLFRYVGEPARDGPASIAVLPFTNLTGDPGQEYLSEGISIALKTRLSEISGVRVIGHVATEDEQGESSLELSRRLGVTAFLEGELQQEEDRLRVNVKLADGASGMILWSETFEGTKEELFALQKEMARKLTDVIAIPLSRGELQRLDRDPTRSFKAYEYYLRGRQAFNDESDPFGADLAVELFRQAIRLDEEFALGHVALSEALWASYNRNAASEKLTEAEQAAQRAPEIDPELPTAQVALARIHRATGRYSASIEELQRVLGHHPKPEEAYRELALSYTRVGNHDDAERCLRAAATIAGNDWFNWNRLGAFLEPLGRYDEAREAFARASELVPPNVNTPQENLAAMTILEGRFDEAIEIYERLPGEPRNAVRASNLGTAYYFSDRPDKWSQAEKYYRLAVRLKPRSATFRRNLADLYQELGRPDEALHNYREALRLVEEQLEDEPANSDLRLTRALYAAKSEGCPTALPLADELETDLPETARNQHRLAQIYALCGREDVALRAIRSAIELGFSSRIIAQESEFRTLRTNPEFVELTAVAASGS